MQRKTDNQIFKEFNKGNNKKMINHYSERNEGEGTDRTNSKVKPNNQRMDKLS